MNLISGFGAKGDGVTDDSAAVLAWITAGCAQGRPCYAPQPSVSYLCNSASRGHGAVSTYSDGFVMYGDGPLLTKFVFPNQTDGLVFPHAVQSWCYRDSR